VGKRINVRCTGWEAQLKGGPSSKVKSKKKRGRIWCRDLSGLGENYNIEVTWIVKGNLINYRCILRGFFHRNSGENIINAGLGGLHEQHPDQ